MKTLTQLADFHRTDKGTLNHKYTEIYAALFEPMREDHFSLLELGVQFGLSLRMWRDYFQHARIVGMDCVDNGVKFKPADRIEIHIGSQSNGRDLESLVMRAPYRIIIDDASHIGTDIVFSLNALAPLLEPGGFYIIEDVHAPDCNDQPWRYLQMLIRDDLNRKEPDQCGDGQRSLSQWESVTFYRSLVVLKKKNSMLGRK